MDAFINSTDYATAFGKLKTILVNHSKYKDLTDLKTLIDNTTSNEQKILIVDKFKTIFSYITNLTDGNADGTNLKNIISHRDNLYTGMI